MATEDMNFLEIVQAVYLAIRETGPTSLSSQTTRTKEVIEAIKDIYTEVCSMNEGHLTFLEADGTITLVTDTREYAFEADCKDVNLDSFVYDSDRQLYYKDYTEFMKTYPDMTESGRPYDFSVWGREFIFGYMPSSDYNGKTVTYMYWKRPDDITTDTDEPLIPDEFRRRILVNGAASRILSMDGDSSWEIKDNIYQRGVIDLKRGYSSITKDKVIVDFEF